MPSVYRYHRRPYRRTNRLGRRWAATHTTPFATYSVGNQSGITADGCAVVQTISGFANSFSGRDYDIRFRSTSGMTGFAFRMYGSGQGYMHLYVDNVPTGSPIPIPGGAGTVDVVIAAGLSGVHEYKVHVGTTAYVHRLLTYGAAIDTSAIAPRDLWVVYGNSITQGEYPPDSDSVYAYGHLLSVSQGVAVLNLGVQATHVWDNDSAGGYPNAGVNRVTQIPAGATRVIVLYGVNDAQSLQYAETDLQFGAAYGEMVAAIRARIGAGKPIHCLKILPVFSGTAQANRSAFNAALVSAATSLSDPGVTVVDTDGWILDEDTVDHLHPDRGGYVKIHDEYVDATTPLAPPILAFVYSTPTSIRLSWTDAEGGGAGGYVYDVYRDGVLHAVDEVSPYDDSGSLSHGVVYTYFVRVTDAADQEADSGEVEAGLPFDGTGGGGSGVAGLVNGGLISA